MIAPKCFKNIPKQAKVNPISSLAVDGKCKSYVRGFLMYADLGLWERWS